LKTITVTSQTVHIAHQAIVAMAITLGQQLHGSLLRGVLLLILFGAVLHAVANTCDVLAYA
jgi:hypothetical protein